MIQECRKCCNTTANPVIKIDAHWVCTICASYETYFNPDLLKKEYIEVQKLLEENEWKCMVGISGWKDSTATLLTLLDRGYTPSAFTFDIWYDPPSTYSRAKALTERLNIAYELIDIRPYISPIDKICYHKLVEAYELPINQKTKQQFYDRYLKWRSHYSTKDETILPYIRPCQICRKIVIKAYYAEARKRGVSLIFLGMNEWAHLSGTGTYSAIRILQPIASEPPVYIIHLPYLLQRTLQQTKEIISTIDWLPPVGDNLVETNHNSCLLAAATEKKFQDMLWFHPDCTRLSREVTVGFLTKEQAKRALEQPLNQTISLSTVLQQAWIL